MSDPGRGRSDALVVFGATGDLARKMLFPALHELARADELPATVVGVAASDWSTDALIDYAKAAVTEYGGGVDRDAFARLAAALTYVAGDYRERETYTSLVAALGGCDRPLLYLAIPPSLFETVVAGLAEAGLNAGGRVVLEKPFGRDLRTRAQPLRAGPLR